MCIVLLQCLKLIGKICMSNVDVIRASNNALYMLTVGMCVDLSRYNWFPRPVMAAAGGPPDYLWQFGWSSWTIDGAIVSHMIKP